MLSPPNRLIFLYLEVFEYRDYESIITKLSHFLSVRIRQNRDGYPNLVLTSSLTFSDNRLVVTVFKNAKYKK